jgi:hypothetical protein
MKNLLKSVSIIILCFITAIGCKKESTTLFKGYFYSIDSASEIPLQLYVDGNFKGTLPYLRATPDKPLSVKDPILITNALTLDILSGHRYSIVAKTIDGTTVVSGYLSVTKRGNDEGGATQGGIGENIEGASMGVFLWR